MRQNGFFLTGLFAGERLWDKTSIAAFSWIFSKLRHICVYVYCIYFLEYPIPAAAAAPARPSQKASHNDISGTKRGMTGSQML